MKTIHQLLIILFLVPSIFLNAQESTFIHGKIINHSSKKISAKFLYNNFTSYKANIVADVNDAGEFKAELIINSPGIVSLNYGKQSVDIYVEPQQNVGVFFDANDVSNSIRFFEKNGFTNNEIFSKINAGSTYPEHLKDMPYDDKLDYVNGIHKTQQSNWERLRAENTTLSDDFIAFTNLQIQYKRLSQLLYHTHIDSLNVSNQKLLKSYYTNEIINNEAALQHPQYDGFLYYFILFYSEQKLGKSLDYYNDAEAIYACIKDAKEFSPAVKEHALGKLLYFNILPSTIGQFDEYYHEFIATATSSDIVEYLKKRYETAQGFTDGKTAPAFELEGKDGQNIRLADFEGKKVYLSFWATWCGPCKREIFNAKNNKTVLKDDLVFIYVSFDENKEKWLNHKVTKEESGVHVWGKEKSTIEDDYGITTIPRTFLIDESGNFIGNFPASDDETFVDFIKNLE